MSDLSINQNKLDESLLRHARYQSLAQTATAYGVSQINTGIKDLQKTTEAQTDILNETMQVNRNIESLTRSNNQIMKAQLSAQQKSLQMQQYDLQMKELRYERERLEKKLEQEEKNHTKLQQNLAFDAYRALKSLASSKFTNVEKAYFYRNSMKVIQGIDYNGLELQDKKFLLDTKDDMEEIGKAIEKKLTKKDIADLDKIAEIMHEDEDAELSKIENKVNASMKATEYMYILSEIKDAYESAVRIYNNEADLDIYTKDSILKSFEWQKEKLENLEKFIDLYSANLKELID